MKKHTYAASSNRFYVGCNTGDFLTLCLEIQLSTGKVILSHAGSNSLYNRTTITYKSDKSQLDLDALEFLHVSAGTRIVPIRNLMICFEKQTDLHPTADTQFSKKSSALDEMDVLLPSKSMTSLVPCPNNVNCLLQLSDNANTHNAKYSHPCRFSELCRNREAHLTHESHRVPFCKHDENCNKLIDAFHRAEYRHTGMPDFLIPCRFTERCDDRSDKHRMRYSHGEQVFGVRTKISLDDGTNHSSSLHGVHRPCQNHRIPCKWGSNCRDVSDAHHCDKYSHPESEPEDDDVEITNEFKNDCEF
ncbi:unnamed protein product [Adineta steineri]|uniref:Uncharacterized protein n=1 Tax=Adineta steineri TaxID=433720 RepID=A0A819CR70_9BILA|nr:unnamed protein product [Adineta steineri]CAF3823368.1 unnamed protein product [Adineta steineri]